MIEPIVTTRLFDDDASFGRFVERIDEVISDHLLYQRQVKPAADDRSCGKGLVGLRGKPRKSSADGFTYALRQGALVPDAATFVDVTKRLDEKERVAAGNRSQCTPELLIVVACFSDVRSHVVLVETAELKAIGRAVTVQVSKHRR